MHESGPPTLSRLMGPSPHFSKAHRVSRSKEGYSYLAKMIGCAYDEEFEEFLCDILDVHLSLAIGRAGR